MDKTTSEIVKEVQGQTNEYMRQLQAKYPAKSQTERTPLELDEERERLKRDNPDFFKEVAIYALVESYSDQSELLRLCKYCTVHYCCCIYWLDVCLYVDTNVKGNEHPPAWTELLGNIEKGVSKGGEPYKIEVLCMFQQSAGIADFCRQHNVELVMPK